MWPILKTNCQIGLEYDCLNLAVSNDVSTFFSRSDNITQQATINFEEACTISVFSLACSSIIHKNTFGQKYEDGPSEFFSSNHHFTKTGPLRAEKDRYDWPNTFATFQLI